MKAFTYRFEDGSEHEITSMTNALLEIMKARHGNLVHNGFTDQISSLQLLRANSHSRGDGFKPGWHPGLGMEIRSNEQYQSELKARGMVEVGNETQKKAVEKKSGLPDEIIKEAIDAGAQISGNEAAALTSGTYKSEVAE